MVLQITAYNCIFLKHCGIYEGTFPKYIYSVLITMYILDNYKLPLPCCEVRMEKDMLQIVIKFVTKTMSFHIEVHIKELEISYKSSKQIKFHF